MLLGLASGQNEKISVYDIGLTNKTIADGLACAAPSGLSCQCMRELLAGNFTVQDAQLLELQRKTKELENLKIEPSAAAGFPGPETVLKTDFCQRRNIAPENVLHILWTTGGRYLPE